MSVQKVNQTTGATTPIAGVPANKINGIQDAIKKNGAKNLLLVKVETGSSDGITYTVNADKSITLNGTATATVYVTVNTPFTLNETCIVTGTPKNLPDRVFMYIQNQSHTFIDYGDGVEAVSGTYGCYIQVPTGTTLTNATFYPMIRLATDTDDTYVPYAMTNKELTDASVTVVALNSTYVNTGTMWYTKRGKQVILNIDNLSITASATQATALNSDKLPKPIANTTYKTRACAWTSKSGGGVALLEVTTSGDFTLGGYLPTALTESCYGQLTYFTNE